MSTTDLKRLKNDLQSRLRKMKQGHTHAIVTGNIDLEMRYEGRICAYSEALKMLETYLPRKTDRMRQKEIKDA